MNLINIFKSNNLFAIKNIITNKLVLDCFDEPHVFFSKQDAELYKNNCKDYNNKDYEIVPWKIGDK